MRKPISSRMPSVVVEYDCRGKRRQKEFASPYTARRFWIGKFKNNKNPKVLKEKHDVPTC